MKVEDFIRKLREIISQRDISLEEYDLILECLVEADEWLRQMGLILGETPGQAQLERQVTRLFSQKRPDLVETTKFWPLMTLLIHWFRQDYQSDKSFFPAYPSEGNLLQDLDRFFYFHNGEI